MPDITRSIKDNISITEYAELLGYHVRQVSAARWTLEEHDSVNINLDPKHPGRQRFIWNSQGLSGSVIDFAIAMRGCSQDEAISELRRVLGGRSGESWHTQRQKRLAEYQPRADPAQLELPARAQGRPARVFAYLNKSRGIGVKLISRLVQEKILYQDKRGNAVFVGRDYDGQPRYCCYRGTLSEVSYRGEARGSQKAVGFSLGLVGADPPPTRLMVFEAPIDALSAATMLERFGRKSEDYAYLSLGGTAPNALEYHLQHQPQLKTIYLCQDNDDAGRHSREKCREVLQKAGFTGRVIDKLPVGKDFNEDLLALLAKNRQLQQETTHELRLEPRI